MKAIFCAAFAGAVLMAATTGPAVGTHVPNFEAADQNGKVETLDAISGPKGSLLVFFRSADW